MSKRLTIVLSDDEYAILEQRAQQERRTVRQMAERLVTQGQDIQAVGIPTAWTLPQDPWQRTICRPNTTDATTYDPSRLTIWNSTNSTSGKLEAVN